MVLERRFHELQRSYHPDKHVQAEQSVRADALDRSSNINHAYRVLRDPIQRMKHLLGLYGFSVDSVKQVPPSLLMAVMEVQEKLSELEYANTPQVRSRVKQELQPFVVSFESRNTVLEDQMDTLSKEWDAGDGPRSERNTLSDEGRAILEMLVKLLAERAYLETLRLSIVAAQKGEPASIRH